MFPRLVACAPQRYTLPLRSRAIAVALLLACTLPCFAKKKKVVPLTTLPPQTVELSQPPSIVATQSCANWAWAAGVETMLRDRGVDLKQDYWVMKANGGTLCVDDLGSLDKLADAVSGDYVLDDGAHVTVTAHAVTGPPAENIDDYIAALQQQRTVVIFLRGRAYLLRGLVYTERIAPNGHRGFELRELRLIDPTVPAAAEQRYVNFVRDKDETADIDGAFNLSISTPEATDWLRRKTATPAPPATDWLREGDRYVPPPTDWTHGDVKSSPPPPAPTGPPPSSAPPQ